MTPDEPNADATGLTGEELKAKKTKASNVGFSVVNDDGFRLISWPGCTVANGKGANKPSRLDSKRERLSLAFAFFLKSMTDEQVGAMLGMTVNEWGAFVWRMVQKNKKKRRVRIEVVGKKGRAAWVIEHQRSKAHSTPSRRTSRSPIWSAP